MAFELQVTNTAGQPAAGISVTFAWDMPGPAPAESRTLTTNANGIATVNVVSGDELSTDTDDDTGQVLFNNPVQVTATCLGQSQSKAVDVVAPMIAWQYKNEQGQYVPWDGQTFGLYSRASQQTDIPLRAVLSFASLPVVGHPVSWGIDKIYDKAGVEVP